MGGAFSQDGREVGIFDEVDFVCGEFEVAFASVGGGLE